MRKKFINTALLAALLLSLSFAQKDFKGEQLKSARVKAAYTNHWKELQTLLANKKIYADNFDLYIRSFKYEKCLEAWVKNTNEKSFTLLKAFAVCASSGKLGPKRRQGDGQVPEGFYQVPSLHPYSDYHLALKVSYPNKSDRLKTTASDPGGDIMIHGKCVTIGCIPLQDSPVEELYLLCLEAMSRRRTVYCDIYPCRLNSENSTLLENNTTTEDTRVLWKNLKKAYDYFELNHSLPKISVTTKGDYVVNP